MSPGLHPFADHFVLARLETPLERSERENAENNQFLFKIALSTLPLIGLVVGVVGTALLTVS